MSLFILGRVFLVLKTVYFILLKIIQLLKLVLSWRIFSILLTSLHILVFPCPQTLTSVSSTQIVISGWYLGSLLVLQPECLQAVTWSNPKTGLHCLLSGVPVIHYMKALLSCILSSAIVFCSERILYGIEAFFNIWIVVALCQIESKVSFLMVFAKLKSKSRARKRYMVFGERGEDWKSPFLLFSLLLHVVILGMLCYSWF